MKSIKYLIIVAVSALSACSNPQPEQKPIPVHESSSADGISIDPSLLASSTDTICGMSLKDGVGDTLTVDGKIYGFCSEGCKKSFAEMVSKKADS